MSREWYNVELSEENARLFRWYLNSQMISNSGIDYEVSEAYNMIHFECFLTEDELRMIDNWLERNVRTE